MKVSWRQPDGTGRHGLAAEPDLYDAQPPFPEFLLDGQPLHHNPDRLAVAAALVFGPYTSGKLEVPSACSPLVATEIARFLAPLEVAVTPVDQTAKALPIGSSVAYVVEEGDEIDVPPTTWGGQRYVELRCLRSDQAAGMLVQLSKTSIATNGWLFRRGHDNPVEARRGSVATAVLFAETLRADVLVIPSSDDLHDELRPLRRLLSAVRLGLAASGQHGPIVVSRT